MAQQAKGLVPQGTSATSVGFSDATSAYRMAGSQLQQAIDQVDLEEKLGAKQETDDQAALARAKSDYEAARAKWDAAVAKFTSGKDHSKSMSLAKEAVPPGAVGSNDSVAIKAAIDAYRAAAAKLGDALALVPQEEQTAGGGTVVSDQVIAAYREARTGYQKLVEDWAGAEQTKDLDISRAKKLADEAKALIPQEIVLTDADSYTKMTELHSKASSRLKQAIGMVEELRSQAGAQQLTALAEVASANEALKSKDYRGALDHYIAAAKLGNAAAMNNAGLILETGQAGRKDVIEAAGWYHKAAEAGYPPAMYNYGLMCEMGISMEQDLGEAVRWYRKAADGKNTSAMNRLGHMYELGTGVQINLREAVRLYRSAAELNDVTAMCNLGVMYQNGRGVEANTTEAKRWYTAAAEKGSAEAMTDLGALFDDAKDYQSAMTWYTRAAKEKDFAPAMCNIGVLYDNGLGVKIDHVEAMHWFRMAAAKGHGMAMYNVAFLYEHGLGVEPDVVEAVRWYRQAWASNDEGAKGRSEEALKRLKFSPESKPPR
jgi:TPR repeat protein